MKLPREDLHPSVTSTFPYFIISITLWKGASINTHKHTHTFPERLIQKPPTLKNSLFNNLHEASADVFWRWAGDREGVDWSQSRR